MGLPASLPVLRILLICGMRVWLLLISAWERSGRVCEVMIRLLASARAFCRLASSLLRCSSNCSSCGSSDLPLPKRSVTGTGWLPLSRASSRWASAISFGASFSWRLRLVRPCWLSAWLSRKDLVCSSMEGLAWASPSAALLSAGAAAGLGTPTGGAACR
ncbi:hypothetical protein D9M69_566310 [compost metagenome]